MQTAVPSIRAYVGDADQNDWDEHAEHSDMAFDTTWLETPCFFVRVWDARETTSAVLRPKPSSMPERSAFEWHRKLRRDYSYDQACAEELQKKAKSLRSEPQTTKWRELSERIKTQFKIDGNVSLYIPRVQESEVGTHVACSVRIDVIHDKFRIKLKFKDIGYVLTVGCMPVAQSRGRCSPIVWLKRSRWKRMAT